MRQTSDRRNDWVARLAFASGVAVMVPSLGALAIVVLAVAALLI
jgi:hypothetical protein